MKNWRFWVALVILGVTARSLSMGNLETLKTSLEMVKHFPWLVIGLALLLCISQLLLMGLRMWSLSPPETALPPVLWAMAYGQFANAFLPARAGEALKLAVLSDRTRGAGIPIATASGVFVADKFLDLLGIIFWILATGVSELPSTIFQKWSAQSIAIFCGIFVFSFFLIYFLWSRWLQFLFPWMKTQWERFLYGIRLIFSFRTFLLSFVFSVATWGCEVFAVKLLVSSLGIPFAIAQSVKALVLLNVAISIPVTIANIGTFEASIVFALGRMGIPMAPALSVAAVHHALQLGGISLGTLFARTLYARSVRKMDRTEK